MSSYIVNSVIRIDVKFSLTSSEYPIIRIEMGQMANVLDVIDVKIEVAGWITIVLHLVFIANPAGELLASIVNSVMSIVESSEGHFLLRVSCLLFGRRRRRARC